MSNVFKIGQVINRFFPRIEKKQEGRYSYGVNDRMPQEQIEMISSNPTALRAILKRAEFICANGFVDDTLNDFKVSKNKTARKLLMETSIQVSFFECLNWHIARYLDGSVASADLFPFEMCRKRLDGNIDYNPTLASAQENNQASRWKQYPLFGTVETVDKNYKGEILYEWIKSPIAFNIPIASWMAGEMDIKTGGEYAVVDYEQVMNGFMASMMLTIIGQVDTVNKDEKTGLTQIEQLKNDIKKWTSASKNPTTGLSERSSVFIRFAQNKDEVPDLQTLDIKELISGSIEKRESIDKSVCRIFNVNPVILDFDVTALLGQDNAMKNAIRNQANTVIPFQNLIKEAFEKVFPEVDGKKVTWDISTLDPYKQIVKKNENQVVLDTLNSLSPLLSAEIVKRMPDDKLLGLVGIKPTENAPN